jgi:hypothetical protein
MITGLCSVPTDGGYTNEPRLRENTTNWSGDDGEDRAGAEEVEDSEDDVEKRGDDEDSVGAVGAVGDVDDVCVEDNANAAGGVAAEEDAEASSVPESGVLANSTQPASGLLSAESTPVRTS